MTERDRLIELIEQHCLARLDALECTADKDIECSECLAEHLLSNGVIVPPCKVGQTVYELRVRGLIESDVRRGYYADHAIISVNNMERLVRNGLKPYVREKCFAKADMSRFGKTVFLTREEAEQALAERSGERCPNG